MLLFRSIQESNIVFLNFQRLPSLKAGIRSSYTYLYKVSGLTPRYCEAWRMFMTSRESAIIRPLPFQKSLSPVKAGDAFGHGLRGTCPLLPVVLGGKTFQC